MKDESQLIELRLLELECKNGRKLTQEEYRDLYQIWLKVESKWLDKMFKYD